MSKHWLENKNYAILTILKLCKEKTGKVWLAVFLFSREFLIAQLTNIVTNSSLKWENTYKNVKKSFQLNLINLDS